MRSTFWIMILSLCLTGCSEMRIIGNAALREFRADGVAVNWERPDPETKVVIDYEQLVLAQAKVKSFSSFKGSSKAKNIEIKGLWEQGGGKYLVAAR